MECLLRRFQQLFARDRCYAALAEWDKVTHAVREEWNTAEPHTRREMAGLAAHAAWHMSHWDEMSEYTSDMRTQESSTGSFLIAVQAVHNQNFAAAKGAYRILCSTCGMHLL